MTLYGWIELNECEWEINTIEIDPTDFPDGVVFDGAGEAFISSTPGRWFKTFAHANRIALVELRRGISWRHLAIKTMRRSASNRRQ